MDYSAKTHRYAYPGCNTRGKIHHWTARPMAAMRLYLCTLVGDGTKAGWVEDRRGRRNNDPAVMAKISMQAPGRWVPGILGDHLAMRCLCGRSVIDATTMRRHLCREWAAITMGAK